MRLFIIFFVFQGVFNVVFAQGINYVNYINPQVAKKHLDYLASNELEGREAGEKGQKLAGAYLMQHFAEFGLPPLRGEYFQRFNLRVTYPEKITMTINGDTLRYFRDFIHNSDFDDVNFSEAPVVFIGYGIASERYNDFKGVDVRGKVVLMFDGEPKDNKSRYLVTGTKETSEWNSRTTKINNLVQRGALGIIMVSPNFEMYTSSYAHSFQSSKMKLETDPFGVPIPLVFISEKKANKLLKAGGITKSLNKINKRISAKKRAFTKELNLSVGIHSDMVNDKITSENVLGFVEGSDKKDEFVIVTAHYDHIGKHDGHIYNGADDDGSGTTALLLMAEAFAKAKAAGNGPRRSILFMPVSAEEKGLLGSRYYSENPIIPLENTIANLNIDMIGRVDKAHHDSNNHPNPNYVYIIGSDFLSNDLHTINEEQNDLHTQLELDYTFNSIDDPNHFYQRSDHYNFAKNGIPVIFYFNGTHEDYHQPTDTVDKIDFEKIAKITQLIYYTAWELANREERIRID
ncbi:MAG: peptidase M28 [Flavobacteriales bacterium]|nr:peptidase M28 [Flavobacteriales bacterium]|tara:strand:- start:103142 stop:104689 length:1548 start_codon:yes stop_codon:yes gene_type:complete